MNWRSCFATTLALFMIFGLLSRLTAVGEDPLPDDELRSVDGEWTFVEDRTEGRSLEQLGPPMASRFTMRVEEGAVILNGHGSGHRDVRVAIGGSITEVKEPTTISRYRGAWKDGAFEYEVAFERLSGNATGGIGLIRRKFRPTSEGLLVTVLVDPPQGSESVGLYRHAEDIPMPEPAKAKIDDLAWLAGAWIGTRGGTLIEERWTQPLGGSMLAVSRSVRDDKMRAFEFLRVIEREGGLVYVAQPGGAKATEFVLTEMTATRAVFENPRHDYPKRIAYELSADGSLSATIGQLKGGTPRRMEWKREGN